MEYKNFKFENYNLNQKTGVFTMDYSIGDLKFSEKLSFPVKEINWKKVNEKALDKALFNLFLIAGISYYKTYCPKKIDLGIYKLTRNQAKFWNKVYTKGLGEFFYLNKIDYRGLVNFPHANNYKEKSAKVKTSSKNLVPLGGGKDSIVTAELLKKAGANFDFLSLRKFKVMEDTAKIAGKKLINIDRKLDEQLFKLKGVYNGHIPFNAYLAFLSLTVAIIYGYKKIVLSNESSANLGNVKYLGQIVNHQYSKSIEFENDFRDYTSKFITPSIEYFSMLRSLNEIEITERFSRYREYFSKFSSCSLGNFKFNGKWDGEWCGECSKCIFVWTMLSAFVSKKELLKIFGKNLYDNKKLKKQFRLLLGQDGFKPFECVGTPEEMKMAMYLAHKRREYENDYIMKNFIKQVLPKIKNIKKLEKQVFKENGENNIPVEFSKYLNINNKKILILGFGMEGKSSWRWLRKKYGDVEIGVADKNELNKFDEKYKDILKKDKNLELHLGRNYLKNLDEYEVIVKTPGIKLNSKAGRDLSKKGIEITSNLNLFLSETKSKVIGITGSKGKSTSASLIYEILKTGKKKVVLVGNIGKPALDCINKDSKDAIFVVEMSSYQLETINQPKIDIALVTSFFPEHLDYHGSLNDYFKAKMNIVRNLKSDGVVVYSGKYKKVKDFIKKQKVKTQEYNGKYKGEVKILGEQMRENIQGVVRVAKILNIKDSVIKKVIRNFKGLPHRIEQVGKHKGIYWINDVLSTTPNSTIAAIDALEKSKYDLGTLIVGGYDRGLNYTKLINKISKSDIDNLICWPNSGDEIYNKIRGNKRIRLIRVKNMEGTIKAVLKYTDKNKTALLSPAASSYDFYKNYKEKGGEFKKLIS